MEVTQVTPAGIANSSTHPLLLVAAASVTILSLAGAATLAGWLPGSGSHVGDPARLASAAPVAPAAPAAAPISIQQTVTVPQEKPKAAAKPSTHAPVSARTAAPMTVAAAPYFPPAPSAGYSYSPPAPAPAICRDCGVVDSVREVAVEAKGGGAGAVTGGILGGYIGNQWGRGATRDIATVLGAVGGAYAGNHIEKSAKETKRYDVTVRFEDGNTRTFSSDTPPAWRSGDRVRLSNGLLAVDSGRASGYPGSY